MSGVMGSRAPEALGNFLLVRRTQETTVCVVGGECEEPSRETVYDIVADGNWDLQTRREAAPTITVNTRNY